jgi:membrane fusion protein (multidrug efflux system)
VQDRAAVRAAQQNLANTPLQRQVIAENRGVVVQSQGSVAQYRTAISQTTINAPFDGVITARSLDPGGFASPSQAIYQISQIDPVYIDFNLKDTDLAYVEPGTLVSFTTSAHPERRYTGRVASVNAQPTSGTLLYRARIVERNPDFSLRGGLQVSVRITKGLQRDALAVPRAAVVQNGATGTIYAIEHNDRAGSSSAGDVAKELTVHLGLQTNTYVAISGPGVRAGMPIVLGQVDNLHDGAAVAPTLTPP